MQNILLKLFLALGGAALVWNFLGKNAKEAAHKGAGALFLKLPFVKSFLKANWPKIQEIILAADAGLEEAVEEETTPPAAGGPSGTPS